MALPTWNLSSLYTGFESREYQEAPQTMRGYVEQLGTYRAALESASLAPEDLAHLFSVYEALQQTSLHYYAYARMSYDVDTQNMEAKKAMDAAGMLLAEIESDLEWLSQAFKNYPKEQLDMLASHPQLSAYIPFFHLVQQYKPFTLPLEQEQLLTLKDRFAQEAWRDFHTEIVSNMEYRDLVIGEERIPMNQSVLKKYLSSPDRAVRKEAYTIGREPLKSHNHILGYVFKQVIESYERDSVSLRGFSSGLDRACLGDEVLRQDVDTMVTAMQEVIPLYQEYFAWKQRQLGIEDFAIYDMGAPLSQQPREIAFDEAKQHVLEMFTMFDPEVGSKAAAFFENQWIDAREGAHKYGGAYSWTMGTNPFILLNFQPKVHEVFTMAHELGHGIHSLYTAEREPYVLRNHSKVTAESASQFAELLLLEYYLKQDIPAAEKQELLAHHIEDILYTLASTLTVTRFEQETHDNILKRPLSAEDLHDTWQQCQRDVLGENIAMTDLDRYAWARVPHIFQTPFYYFTYPMSLLVALNLYGLYRSDPEGFLPKYKEFLRYGTSKRPADLLRDIFGMEFGTKAFYEAGLSEVRRLLAMLSA